MPLVVFSATDSRKAEVSSVARYSSWPGRWMPDRRGNGNIEAPLDALMALISSLVDTLVAAVVCMSSRRSRISEARISAPLTATTAQ
jgi:hypothetical protein